MVSLELVPRSIESLVKEAKQALSRYPELQYINIPDVIRLDIRSWEATEALLRAGIPTIPHIRAMDHRGDQLNFILKPLIELGLEKVVIISGDAPDFPDFKPSGETPITLTSSVKQAFPSLKVYGAVDPYRQNFKDEIAYVHKKIAAGMDGVFSQAFFDSRLLEIYLDQLEGITFFAGISPVNSEKSVKYWERINQVVFPKKFDISIEANAKLANEILSMVKAKGQHAYLMPILISSEKYLKSFWGERD